MRPPHTDSASQMSRYSEAPRSKTTDLISTALYYWELFHVHASPPFSASHLVSKQHTHTPNTHTHTHRHTQTHTYTHTHTHAQAYSDSHTLRRTHTYTHTHTHTHLIPLVKNHRGIEKESGSAVGEGGRREGRTLSLAARRWCVLGNRCRPQQLRLTCDL